MRSMRGRVVALLAAMVLGSALPAFSQPVFWGAAARVNGVEISNEALEHAFEEYLRERGENIGAMRQPARVKEVKRATLDLLIDQELAWQAAEKSGVLATPEEVDRALADMADQFHSREAFLARLDTEGYTEEGYREHLRRLASARKYLEHVAGGRVVDDTEVHAFYVANLDEFRLPEQVRARHILLRLPPDADEARVAAATRRLEGLRVQLDAGADFAALAREHSEDAASTTRGGDLGFFARGQMVAPFEAAAFALEPGEVSPVVRSSYGLHLIRVEERRPAETVPEDQAREQVRTYLQARGAEDAVSAELRRLRANARIEVLIAL